MTALMYAARAGHADIVDLLIQNKAKVDKEDEVQPSYYYALKNSSVADIIFIIFCFRAG